MIVEVMPMPSLRTLTWTIVPIYERDDNQIIRRGEAVPLPCNATF
jgi:hypothetical protein